MCGQNGAQKKDKDSHLHGEIIRHLHTNNKAHTFSSPYSADRPLPNYSQPLSSPVCPCVFVDSTPPTVAISYLSHSSAATSTKHTPSSSTEAVRDKSSIVQAIILVRNPPLPKKKTSFNVAVMKRGASCLES